MLLCKLKVALYPLKKSSKKTAQKKQNTNTANIADQCENTSMGELPSVIILDNLHHVGSLGEVFNGFLSVKYQKWWVEIKKCVLYVYVYIF